MKTAADRRFLGISVLEAARQRVVWTFETFPKVYVSFSGGKDSTVMLHIVAEEARRLGRRFGLLFVDWEAQFNLTVEHVERCFAMYEDCADPYWVAVPLRTTNACSQVEPEWTCWEPGKEDLWVRPKPEQSMRETAFPFWCERITFEEFVPEFGHWYGEGQLTACFVGIRTRESLNRWRTISGRGTKFEGRTWTNWPGRSLHNIYPIYDWHEQDVWTYHGKTGLPHNMLYDRMHRAGLSLSQMRICEPYGDEQRRGLWLYQIVEPETWARVSTRVAGANTGALYAGEKGNVLGNIKIALPPGHTWHSFAEFLLDSMPPQTADHYRDKIAVWMQWYRRNMRLYEIPDEQDGDTGPRDVASWRRVCKMLLKNDYWAKTLCFSPTKATAYERYRKIMRRRRAEWGIYDDSLRSE